MTSAGGRNLVMLVVEDNPADVVFLNEAIETTGTAATVHVVSDGEDALRFLRREGPYAETPRPDLVVLDLNLPLKNGRDVLAGMMGDPILRTIPVAILSTSSSEAQICESYTSGRCLYFVKTDELGLLQEIVKQIATYAKTVQSHGQAH